MSSRLVNPKYAAALADADGDTLPPGNLVVSTRFMESYEIARAVSGGTDLTTFQNNSGHLDVYTVGTANRVSRIRPQSAASAAWVEEDLGIVATQLSVYSTTEFGRDTPNILGLDDDGILTLSVYDEAKKRYVQKVSEPEKNTTKIRQFLATKHLTNVYANVILETGEVATSFLRPDGSWASTTWVPIKAAKGSSENAKVSRIAMCANSAQRPLYAIGLDNSVLFTEPNNRFAYFTKLGSLKAIAITVIQDSDNLLNIFAVDINLRLWQKKEKKYSSGGGIEFEDWVQLDARTPLAGVHAVINARGLLEIFAIGGDGLLYHTQQRTDGSGKVTGWNPLFPLGNPVPSSIFTVGKNGLGYSEAYSVTSDNRLYRFWQDPNTTQWYDYEIPLRASAELVPVPTHSVEFSVLDDAGLIQPHAAVTIRTSNLVGIRVNGLSYIASEFTPLTVQANASGMVVIDRMTTSLSSPSYSIYTDFMDDGDSVVVEPNASLQIKMRATTKEDVLNAKSSDGKYLLDGVDRTDENADHLARIMQKSMSLGHKPENSRNARYLALNRSAAGLRHIRRGHSGSHFRLDPSQVEEQHWKVDFSSGAPRCTDLTRAEAESLVQTRLATAGPEGWFSDVWGDMWNAFKRGVGHIVEGLKEFIVTTIVDPLSGLVDKIRVVFNFVIEGVEQFVDATIEFFQQAFDIIEGVWNKLKVTFEQLYDWLKFLFAWDDIKRTAEVVKHTFNQSLEFAELAVRATRDRIKNGIDGFRKDIDTAVNDYLKTINGQQGLGGYSAEHTRPNPDLDEGTGHNILLNAFVDNSTDAKQTSSASLTAATFDPEPFKALVDELNKLADNFEFGDGKQAFEDAIAYFSEIGTSPDKFVQLAVSGAIKVMEAIALFGIALAEGLILSLFDVIADLIKLIRDLMNDDWEIPLVSDIYKMITGESLTFKPIEVFSLIVAIPGTVVFKLANGEAPYPTQESVEEFKRFYTAQWLAEQSGIAPPSAMTAEARAAAGGPRGYVAKVFNSFYAITMYIRIPLECTQIALDVEKPTPNSTVVHRLGVVTSRILTSFFTMPWIVKEDAGPMDCADPRGTGNVTWLLQVLFGPCRGYFIIGWNTFAPPTWKFEPQRGDQTLTVWGGLHFVLACVSAGRSPEPDPGAISRDILGCLAPQLFRFAAIHSLNVKAKFIPSVALIVGVGVTYTAMALIAVLADDAEPEGGLERAALPA